MKKISLILLCCALIGCAKFKEQRTDGAVAEYRGSIITQADISALTEGLSAEDSARVAKRYILQWATDLLIWEEAKSLNNKDIDRKVAEYRRALCLYEWEQRVVNQRMPHLVEDSMIVSFYDNNKRHFVLRDAIVEGALLVVPNGAPNMERLRSNVANIEVEESIEWVEKYAYQYATGYELFLSEWKTGDKLLQRLPTDKQTFHKQLKQKKQIELQDSLNTYLLQVTSVHHSGDFAPLDYVRGDIEKMLLNRRQVDFLKETREKMYNKALDQGELKIYE